MDTALRAAIEDLRDRPIAATDKGFGRLASAGRVTAASLAVSRPSLFGADFVLPLVVLREEALRHNIESMARYCRAAGVQLAPHGKTTMAPQLIARQIAAGAWGVSAATIAQVQVFRAFGMPRILIASEITDRNGIDWLASELAADPGFSCYCFVDSVPGIALLADALTSNPGWQAAPCRTLPVLVELGQPGGRTGCRSVPQAIELARVVAATDSLRLAGAAGFEGSIGHDDDPRTLAAVEDYCHDLRTLAEMLPSQAPEVPLLSAGGSAFFDIVTRTLTTVRPGGTRPDVVLRSGAYITHDHGFYARIAPGGRPDRCGPALEAGLELWAPVLARPEPELAIACAGRRDVSFDQGMPVPIRIRTADGRLRDADAIRVTGLDDQHAYLSVPEDAGLGPGDAVCLGISHPCTTFDKWRVIPVVDDEYRVVDAVHTFF